MVVRQMRMSSTRLWQITVVLLLTVMISLNLRILLDVDKDVEQWDAMQQASDCDLKLDTVANVQTFNASQAWFNWVHLDDDLARVYGHRRPTQSVLTIGVPTIKRENGLKYLMQTIGSLVEKSSIRQKSETVVVVFLADFDSDYNNRALQTIAARYMSYINMGFIQVVQVAKSFYPPLERLKQNFNDAPERVQWRAKQVADFSFLFLYSQNISTYYMQLEDDVLCAPNFISGIQDFARAQKTSWAVLEFSELGFIGKLFKSSDLQKLAQFMMTFYDEQPIDWLIRYYRLTMAQSRQLLRKPTLFQHIGLTSSFDTSRQNKLQDRYFDTGEKQWKSDDPPASVVTSLKSHDTYIPDLAYGSGSGYFWAHAPTKGDTFFVIFDQDERLKRIIIETGNDKHPHDILKSAILEVSPKLLRFQDGKVTCADWRNLGRFVQGRIDVDDLDTKLGGRTSKCIKVSVTGDQDAWVVIQQVAVYVEKPA